MIWNEFERIVLNFNWIPIEFNSSFTNLNELEFVYLSFSEYESIFSFFYSFFAYFYEILANFSEFEWILSEFEWILGEF